VASKNQHVSTGGIRALLQAPREARNAKEQQKPEDRKIVSLVYTKKHPNTTVIEGKPKKSTQH